METETKPKHRASAGALVDARYEELKQMLISRQREMLNELQGKIRSVRAEGSRQDRAGLNPGDSEVDIQDDLEFALIQMKAETASKINEALVRLEEGSYGLCFECGDEIAQPRLRALPFAVRCKDCEEAVEIAQQRDRARARRASSRPRLRDARLTSDPRDSIERGAVQVRRSPAITRWQLPRVGTFESEGEAACVSIQVALPPAFCCRGIPSRPWQWWCVRRRSDRWCHRGVTSRLIAGANGSRRSARLHRGSLPVPRHCEALARCRATRNG